MTERLFDPEGIFATLERSGVDYVVIGGMAGTIHGSHHVTFDVDITPSTEPSNMARLSAALTLLEARIRTPDAPEGLAFRHTGQTLAGMAVLNLVTKHGDLDISLVPSGTDGYEDLITSAVAVDVGSATVWVAALDDVIRSKSAANRAKDKVVLPTLRRLRELLDREP